ncbi:hypothetical protein HanPI659440_Chr03g0106781 [Helianthus annuus]|nr:hypothetical protein HanPI659440_Chr03g0106781 [Helianthus annuus]
MAAMVVGCLPGLILLFCCCFKLEQEFFFNPMQLIQVLYFLRRVEYCLSDV